MGWLLCKRCPSGNSLGLLCNALNPPLKHLHLMVVKDLCPLAAEIKVGEEHVGGVIEEVTPGMKLPRPKKK